MLLRIISYFDFSVTTEIQLKTLLSHSNAKIYDLDQKVKKIEATNKSLRKLLTYYKNKEKLRKSKDKLHAAAETEKVFILNLHRNLSILEYENIHIPLLTYFRVIVNDANLCTMFYVTFKYETKIITPKIRENYDFEVVFAYINDKNVYTFTKIDS